MKRLEMEMNQKQREFEMVKLDAKKTLQKRGKERCEIRKLEAELAKTEYSQLLFNENSSSHHSHVLPGLPFRITSITCSLTTPIYSRTFPAKNTQVDKPPSVSTQAYTLTAVSRQLTRFLLRPHRLTRFLLCPPKLTRFPLCPRKLTCL